MDDSTRQGSHLGFYPVRLNDSHRNLAPTRFGRPPADDHIPLGERIRPPQGAPGGTTLLLLYVTAVVSGLNFGSSSAEVMDQWC